MNDLIEKLSNLRGQFNCFDKNESDAYHTLSEAIKVISERTKPCEDAVSREAVYEAMVEKGQRSRRYRLGETWELNGTEIREALDTVPSVTPKHKTWKWIEYDSDDDKYDVIKCPCCKHTFTVDAYHWTDIGFTKDDFKFCPNCNADMRGKQE